MRNGSAMSHTSGARTRTANASGQDNTSKMHQRTRTARNLIVRVTSAFTPEGWLQF